MEKISITAILESGEKIKMKLSPTRKQEITRTYKSKPVYDFIKRAFDIIFSGIALICFIPFFLVVAVLIKLEDGGPVIYARICEGKDGHQYKMYKFRSMVVDADKLNKWLASEQIEKYYREAKVINDPRITKIGAFLRKSSIDELPQLISVLCNSMSLVGPRPITKPELINYTDKELKLLLAIKPGITGYWQVNGRSNCTYGSGERQRMELYYVEHRSLWLDLKILFKTISVVVKKVGVQ